MKRLAVLAPGSVCLADGKPAKPRERDPAERRRKATGSASRISAQGGILG